MQLYIAHITKQSCCWLTYTDTDFQLQLSKSDDLKKTKPEPEKQSVEISTPKEEVCLPSDSFACTKPAQMFPQLLSSLCSGLKWVDY